MTTSTGSLLVVDDEEMNRDMLRRRLELEGFTVSCAEEGAQALKRLSEETFDAVLLDVMMPGLNGFEVLAEIRKSRSMVELPVLMVTAKCGNEDIINAFSVGANDFISKPINFPVALARINCHVASKNLSMQLRKNEAKFSADPLTGLPNRVLFMDQLERAIQTSVNDSENNLAVLFIDLDRFKFVNDTLGHQAGDELLVTVARRLESCLRGAGVGSDPSNRSTVARFGGDEFVVLLRGLTDRKMASVVAERILSVLGEPVSLDANRVSVTCSIGIAFASNDHTQATDLLRDADIAMYRAKSDGRSRVCVYDETLRSHTLERLTLEADMKSGIERGQFQLVYQPIVALPSERIEGFEALLRWEHPTKGLISPSQFVPIAEETGFITELGAWSLEQACYQFREWQLGVAQQMTLFISVNVSARQFAEPDFLDRITKCLKKTELDAHCLNLEITESVIMRDPELAAQKLKRLREIGVRISLDNFGTGYSSLSYLRQFPIDILKIDRSFIDHIDASRQVVEIVKTIVSLARNLGMQVAAKGIERRSQLARLNEIAFETGQGYLYSRAVSKTTIEELLKEIEQAQSNDRSDQGRTRRDREPLFAHAWS